MSMALPLEKRNHGEFRVAKQQLIAAQGWLIQPVPLAAPCYGAMGRQLTNPSRRGWGGVEGGVVDWIGFY